MIRNIAIAGCVAVLMGLASTSTLAQQVSGGRPSEVMFIAGVKDSAGKWMPQPGDSVLHLPGRSFYGWTAEMPSDEPVAVKEVLSLPARAKVWPASATVSADGRTGTVVRTLRPENGWVLGAWTVAEGDPLGEYTLAVSIANQTHTFRFQVVPFSASGPGSLDRTRKASLVTPGLSTPVGASSGPTGAEGE